MPLFLLVVFWLCVASAIVSQAMILHSTMRAMRASPSERARRGIEWAYAIVPAVALMVVLAATWQASHDHAARLELEAKANLTGTP